MGRFCSPSAVVNFALINSNNNNNKNKYSQLSNSHVFVPVAIETEGTWQHQAVELVQEIGRRTAIITGDVRESTFLFQQLFVALQYRGECGLISKHVHSRA